MAIQYRTTLRNARLDAVESDAGTDAILRVYTGSAPAATTDAATGTLLVSMTLPTDWMAAASSGSKAKSGTWSGTASGGSASTPGYFRIWNNGVTVTTMQGSCAIGSGDINFDGTITSGQTVTVSSFTLTEGNA